MKVGYIKICVVQLQLLKGKEICLNREEAESEVSKSTDFRKSALKPNKRRK